MALLLRGRLHGRSQGRCRCHAARARGARAGRRRRRWLRRIPSGFAAAARGLRALLLLEAGREPARYHRPEAQSLHRQLCDVLSLRMGATNCGTVRRREHDSRVAQMLDHFIQYVGSSPYGPPAVERALDRLLTAAYLTRQLLNRSVHKRMPADRLSTTFAALADPTRRAILARLASGEASVTELAEPFEMSLPASPSTSRCSSAPV